MRKTLMAMAVATLVALPTFANAAEDAAGNAAAGAAVGAGVGFAVGGPVGAAVGAGSTPRTREEVVIERERRPVRERSCARDSFGNTVCEEIRR